MHAQSVQLTSGILILKKNILKSSLDVDEVKNKLHILFTYTRKRHCPIFPIIAITDMNYT
jgi:hypothetical protein